MHRNRPELRARGTSIYIPGSWSPTVRGVRAFTGMANGIGVCGLQWEVMGLDLRYCSS